MNEIQPKEEVKKMKDIYLSNGIIKEELDEVFIKSTNKAWNRRNEAGSLLWDVEKYNVGYKKHEGEINLFQVPARCLKHGEDVYDQNGNWIAYRSN